MLFQPSNISPSTLSGIGAGTVDVTQGLTVSWQVNGDTPMTAYQIIIYQNDTASTQKYSTGKISLLTPFHTHDKNGNPQFFSTKISAANLSAAGIVNGYANGYKIIITQWWGSGTNDYVAQTSASVFNTLANPTLTIDTISGSSISETITATYSQAQGDPISTVEWIFAVAGNESSPIRQTGTVTTQILEFDVDGLMDGTTYSVECNVVTAGGVYISTGFVQFTVSYSITTEQIQTTVGKINGSNGVYLSWTPMSSNNINWYDIYRQESDIFYLKKVATVSANLREVVDYGVGSGATVQYLIIGLNDSTPVSSTLTQVFTPVFWDYSILLCYTGSDGLYHVDSEYRFGLNVETGNVSNNNEPSFQLNFTKYPNRQPISALYKSGTLKSYIGKSSTLNQYVGDTLTLENAILSISTSKMTKFLKTRKGEVLMVETNSSIDMKVTDESPLQPLYTTINWTEVGDTSNISIVSEPTDEFFPIITSYTYSDELSGSLVTLSTENGGLPFKYLSIALQPIQSGSGTPSPDNERPITGSTGANAYREGANLHDDQTDMAGYYINQNGVITQSANYRYSALIPVQAGSTYRFSGFNARPVGGTDTKRVHGYDSNGEWVAQIAAQAIPGQEDFSIDVTIPQEISFVRLSFRIADNDIVFSRIDNYAEDWSSEVGTVYAGTVDIVSGKLLSRPYYPSYNGETLVGPWVSSMDEYAPGTTPTTGAQVVDMGGTETETQLTPQEVLTLVGQNNVWSDAGDVSLVYATAQIRTVKNN